MRCLRARVGDISTPTFRISKPVYSSKPSFLCLFLIWTVRCAFSWTGIRRTAPLYIGSCVLVTVFQIIPSFIYLLSSNSIVGRTFYHLNLRPSHFEAGLYIGSMVGYSFELIMRTMYGQCESYEFFDVWGCNPAHELRMLPQDSSFLVIITPFVLSALFPNVSTKVAALSQALSVAGLLTALLIANCSASLWYTVAGLLICSISLHSGMNIWSLKLDLPPMSRVAKRPINVRIPNNNSHNSRSFSNASSPANSVSPALAGTPVRGLMSPASNTGSNGNLLKFSIPKGSGKGVVSGVSAVAAVPAGVAPTASLPMSASKNGAFDFETEMQEFKSLIANAAHDLKTPLSAYMSGIEMSSQVVTDMEARLALCASFLLQAELSECYTALKDDLAVLTSTLHSMSNTNSFMLMSINRTIDFSKASNGIMLVPRPESFVVRDVLYFAMNCVRDLNPHANIQFDPVPDDVASSIVTEKQWLLDNLLCLVSNAVKFSPVGNEVRVSIHLRRRRTLPQTHSSNKHPLVSETSKILSSLHRMSSRLPAGAVLEKGLVDKGLVLIQDKTNSLAPTSGTNDNYNAHNTQSSSAAFSVTSIGSESENDMMVLVEVEDHGIGIVDEATRKSLFHGYQQMNRLSGGAGLGLYSLSLRMQALAGAYGCQGRRDKRQGSLFWFAFPYIPDNNVEDFACSFTSQPRTPKTPVVPSLRPNWSLVGCDKSSEDRSDCLVTGETVNASLSGSGCMDSSRTSVSGSSTSRLANATMKILVVDDSPSILKMSSTMLRRKGYEVDTAANGLDAVTKFDRLTVAYDVILMDLQMPIMDGLEAMRRIRQIERERAVEHRVYDVITEEDERDLFVAEEDLESDLEAGIPKICLSKKPSFGSRLGARSVGKNIYLRRNVFIVGVSACSDSETVEDAFQAGADVFIAKPFTVESFLQATKLLREEMQRSGAGYSLDTDGGGVGGPQ